MKKLHYKNRELPYIMRLAICPLAKAAYIVGAGYATIWVTYQIAMFLTTF